MNDCCGMINIYVEYSGDTILISFDSSYGGCTCYCGYEYDFTLPIKGTEKFIKYDDELVYLTTINEPKQKLFTVFPNPTNEILFIDTDFSYDLIEIFTLNGTKVFESIFDDDISLTNLHDGIYQIVISFAGNDVASTWIIKE